jgi:DNA-binding response OmpR family regulator
MPGLGGRGSTRRSCATGPDLARVAFVTGDTMGPAARAFLDGTDRPRLEKPIAPGELRALVRRMLLEAPHDARPDPRPRLRRRGRPARDARRIPRRRGFAVTLAGNAEELRAALAEGATVDAIVLDIAMPGEDGLSVLRGLRAAPPSPPVIMLTAAGETVDRILGLEMGADDYLGKPVDLRELEARIKAVLRRAGAPAPGLRRRQAPLALRQVLARHLGEAPRRGRRRGAADRDGVRLLKLFAENRGRVLNRDQILEGAHDRSWDPFDRSIDIRISRIRKKIESTPRSRGHPHRARHRLCLRPPLSPAPAGRGSARADPAPEPAVPAGSWACASARFPLTS